MRSRGTAFSSAGCAMAPPGPGGTVGDPEEAAEGPAVDGADAVAGAEDRALADSMAARISFLLMRPPAPLPSIPARSTWFSFARRRTRGELRISLPLPRPEGAAPAAGRAAGAAAAGVAEAAGAAAGAGGAGATVLDVSVRCAEGAGVAAWTGDGAGAAVGAPVDAPTASITATTVWIGTVCPSVTLISLSTPAEGAGISASTLSVEISNSGSSRSMRSPGFLSHLVMVPSKMLSPIWGMMTSTAMAFLFPFYVDDCPESQSRESKVKSRQLKVESQDPSQRAIPSRSNFRP